MRTRTIAKVGLGALGYSVWAFMAYLDSAQRPDFLKFNIAIVTGVFGLALRDMQPPSPPPPKDPS